MWFILVDCWVDWDDVMWVYCVVVVMIMLDDMGEIDCFGYVWYLIKFVCSGLEVWIFLQLCMVVFEMCMIDWIKVYGCGEQLLVCFGQMVVGQIVIGVQQIFKLVKGLKQWYDGFIIGGL